MRTLVLFVAVVVAIAAPAAAQIQSRPTDPPLVTALNESWYQLREPLQFAGELYYPAGAAVFFNGNTMVRTGHYNGVPLYADATVEPFSVVLVPISRGLLQPYERPRRGQLAGTTGSRPPSFPVRPTPDSTGIPMAAVSPTGLPVPPGAINVYTPEPAVVGTTGASGIDVGRAVGTRGTAIGTGGTPGAVGTTGVSAVRRTDAVPLVSMRPPANNDGVWIQFGGEKWVSAGTAIPFAASDFIRVGEHAGFPVFARRELTQEIIYLPTRPGFIAPYRIKTAVASR